MQIYIYMYIYLITYLLTSPTYSPTRTLSLTPTRHYLALADYSEGMVSQALAAAIRALLKVRAWAGLPNGRGAESRTEEILEEYIYVYEKFELIA